MRIIAPIPKVLLGLLAFLALAELIAQVKSPEPLLRDLTFEELARISVTTVSRHQETVFHAPAAVAVLEADELSQLGATTVMDALRFAPGVQVAQINPTAWGIGIRGFNSQDSRKLLVMRDGRSVYDTLFSGVWWDVQDPLMDNVSRIEIVRGPGGTLWGANAVNGVINIISKTAAETLGSRLSATVLSDNQRVVSVRHGWTVNPDAQARVSLQERRTGDVPLLDGLPGRNGHRLTTGSFRLDHGTPAENGVTLHGNFHQGTIRQSLLLPILTAPYTRVFEDDVEVAGGSLHGRWDHTAATCGTFTMQAFYEYFQRGPISLDQRNRTLDVDFQHQAPATGNQQIIWGAGFRNIADRLGSGSGSLSFSPSARTRNLFSAFVQDEMAVLPELLSVTMGTKLERNDYSGWEVQPSLRLSYTPDSTRTLWAAVSRAVRTPDRTSDFMLRLATLPPPAAMPNSLPTEVAFRGGQANESEDLLAAEVGARFEPGHNLRLDIACYWNEFTDLVNFSPGPIETVTNPPRNISYVGSANQAQGQSWGGEINLVWQAAEHWRLTTNYSRLQMELNGPGLPFLDNSADQNPSHMASLHSSHAFGSDWRFDLMVRRMGRLPSWEVEAYTEVDMQLVWRPAGGWEISLLGRNLLNRDHFEAPSGRTGQPSVLVRRSVGIQASSEF